MAHVELSLTEVFRPQGHPPVESGSDSFTCWTATVSAAAEPCMVIDAEMAIAAASSSCCTLLGLGAPARAVGCSLLDAGLRLVDFTAARSELTELEIDKIPPLLAITSGRLARGLLRVQPGAEGATDATVDAIATPLLIRGAVAGSLTFFAEV